MPTKKSTRSKRPKPGSTPPPDDITNSDSEPVPDAGIGSTPDPGDWTDSPHTRDPNTRKFVPAQGSLRNRVIERRRIRGADLVPNDRNWREHGAEQSAAMKAVLLELGQAGELLAYHSERNGGKLTLIDGRLRSKDFPTELWDVAITDLNDKEADRLLAVHDQLTTMATTDPLKLGALVGDLDAETEELQKLLDQIGSEAGDVTFEDVSGDSEAGPGSRNDGVTKMKVKIRPVLSVEQVRTFEEAIQATGKLARGEAITEICEAYLASKAKR